MSRDGCHALAIELGLDLESVVEYWSERAAIREFDGGQARDVAERDALADARAQFTSGLALGERRGPRSVEPPVIAAKRSSEG